MKGIIFNLLEEYVQEKSGDEAWDQILDNCTLSTIDPLAIVGPGTYPDSDFLEMVRQTADFVGVSDSELLNNFGSYALPLLAKRYPKFFAPFQHPKDFLKFVGMVHQTEIKKLYKDAETPQFSCREEGDDRVVLVYTSKRRLGQFVKGLLFGLADHYQIPIKIENAECVHEHEAHRCEFTLVFGQS